MDVPSHRTPEKEIGKEIDIESEIAIAIDIPAHKNKPGIILNK